MNVFNLSSKPLSQTQLDVLNNGLSFVPTSHINDFEIKTDLFRFFRTIKLREFFGRQNVPPNTDSNLDTQETTTSQLEVPNAHDTTPVREETPFRSKSYFMPPGNANSSIDTYCMLVTHDIDQLLKEKDHKHEKYSQNLTKVQRQALNELKSDPSRTVKCCDKGGGICVLDTTDYVNECQKQLSDGKFYKQLPSDPTNTFMNEQLALLDNLLTRG